jgi:hypothetical protein
MGLVYQPGQIQQDDPSAEKPPRWRPFQLAFIHSGVFRFSIETGMAGQWELVVTAAVPGEPAPVTGKVIYNAK